MALVWVVVLIEVLMVSAEVLAVLVWVVVLAEVSVELVWVVVLAGVLAEGWKALLMLVGVLVELVEEILMVAPSALVGLVSVAGRVAAPASSVLAFCGS